MQSTGAADRDIIDVWKDINQDPKRRVKVLNAHANMKWWLEATSLRSDFTTSRRTARIAPLNRWSDLSTAGFQC